VMSKCRIQCIFRIWDMGIFLVEVEAPDGDELLEEALREGPFFTANLFFFKAC